MKRNYDFSNAQRGPVLTPQPGKARITIRIDEDILQWFRDQVHAGGGGNYQTMMNDALRAFIASRDEPIEDTLRRVVREELRAHDDQARAG